MPHDAFPMVPFTRAELGERGTSAATLRRALDEGDVRRVVRGVYVLAAVPDSVELRCSAVAKVMAPGHVACDRTAAWLHGVDVLGLSEGRTVPPLEICSFRGHRPTGLAEVRGRSRDLAPADVTAVGGIRVTTPLRTALDLGCILRRRDALAAIDQLRGRYGIREEDLRRSAVRYFRRRGVVQLRALIPLSDPAAESVRESWTRLAIIDAGLPRPVLQHEIVVGGVVVARLDHAYPRERVGVEYDGEEFHDAPQQVAHDAQRRARLSAHGWRVVVVRKGDFTGRRLEAWIRDLRESLQTPYVNLRW